MKYFNIPRNFLLACLKNNEDAEGEAVKKPTPTSALLMALIRKSLQAFHQSASLCWNQMDEVLNYSFC